ncbi:MAG: dTDP-glucose 4,6-dehydratase [Verrucomicrobia bacterium CG_4_10_14_3_um_filter_43_23]|nr:MAG: dTDP-glucose 4,6-dehydratase [Verrucomicrobia bacterium CG1_02_43_26]PIP59022.1 MAG: dTDP-glucose 4,6-dehydratase [Verrucomicrobia bacterium CG22_combo_CG10-13_8_21_14_all_43_17]PIX59119.1 MAG: dTDP-glucose 4,6-dehydratase [Verrucomicrobia bacterium CG_4_10_14_3_um_filter_43_23]PIY61359.1 MAG: dTDP-glucose 4,6-dehydratase [Verrucomicrobia bacterium CG_4_10_14_0_8_um_filter_43_34]PJA44141.1 MAG: dTDP-glucose 4,6-dehydratase [Verrucomicrobia bacterium CG_4_9_14_3_um_filter_43_20]
MPALLVTGGAGFIGSNFIHYCLETLSRDQVDRVINLDKLTYSGNLENLKGVDEDPRYDFIQGDIGDRAFIEEILKREKITQVINFAAETHVDRSIDSPKPFFQTNVMGTIDLLEACRTYYKRLNSVEKNDFRFLHISTDEVFGSLSATDPAFIEESCFSPNSPYAASKASGDHIVRVYRETYGLPVLKVNCSNNYGPYQFPEKLIPLMILNALEEKPLPVYGDGENVRDWLYVEDHCEAIFAVLVKGRLGEAYNIGGLCEKKNNEVVDMLCSILDELRPRSKGGVYSELIKYVKDRPGHDRRYAINCDKIQKETGWRPKHTFSDGLRKTIQWYLGNQIWCEHIAKRNYQRQRLGLGND